MFQILKRKQEKNSNSEIYISQSSSSKFYLRMLTYVLVGMGDIYE